MVQVYCVSGIDTDIGKTIATGLLARSFRQNGINVITQKIVQTGCTGISEDIIRHRQLMGIELLPADLRGLTCPYVFPVPCSPHLAARIAGREIDCETITACTTSLLQEYDLVILEGAGGLLVPLTENYTFLDYLEDRKYPLILVTSSRLGSINHTLSAFELARDRNIEIAGVIYNRLAVTDTRIAEDSRKVFALYLQKYGFSARIVDLPPLASSKDTGINPDFYTMLFA